MLFVVVVLEQLETRTLDVAILDKDENEPEFDYTVLDDRNTVSYRLANPNTLQVSSSIPQVCPRHLPDLIDSIRVDFCHSVEDGKTYNDGFHRHGNFDVRPKQHNYFKGTKKSISPV